MGEINDTIFRVQALIQKLKCCPNCRYHGILFDGGPGICSLKGGPLTNWEACSRWDIYEDIEPSPFANVEYKKTVK
jgi:hypothetical protein